MIYRITILFALLFSVIELDAQKIIEPMNDSERAILDNIASLSKHLKSTLTPDYSSSQKVDFGKDIYDEIVNEYFDLEYLRDSLKDMGNSTEQRIALQKLFLYNADHYLDVLPSDSIFVSPLRLTDLRDEAMYYPLFTFVVYFVIEGKPFYHTVLLFNKTGKLQFISPLIHFEKSHSEESIRSFFKRNGFSKIESKLIRI